MAYSHKRIVLILVFIFYCDRGLEASISTESGVITNSQCYGSSSQHIVSCGPTSLVAITAFNYGFKGNSQSCPTDGSASGSCCSYDNATDCLEAAPGEVRYMDQFSGKRNGLLSTANAVASTCPTSSYSSVSLFSELQYQCVEESRMFEMCTPVTYTSDVNATVYLHNRGYTQGTGILASDTSCQCSIEVLSTTASTLLHIIHMDLQDTANCQQSITLSGENNNNLKTFACETPTYNTILNETISARYFNVTFSNAKTTTAGKFWLGFQGLSTTDRVKINCPAVSKIDCGTPPSPTNGNVINTDTSYGSTATYSCQSGYSLDSGDVTRTCQENGTWSGTLIVCSSGEIIPPSTYDCGSLSDPSNGQVTVTGTTAGNSATYNCDNDYRLIGNMHRYCIHSSGWNGTDPTCLYDCGTPPDIANGDVNVPDTTVGTTVTYSCNVGYSLDGNMHRSCIAGNGWNGSQPNCVSESAVGGSTANGGLTDGEIIAIVFGALLVAILIALIITCIAYRIHRNNNQLDPQGEDPERQPAAGQRDVNRNGEKDNRSLPPNGSVKAGVAPADHSPKIKSNDRPVSRDSGRETSQDSIKVTRPTTRDSRRENLVEHADGHGNYNRTFDSPSPHQNEQPVHPYIMEDVLKDQRRPRNRLEPISQHPHTSNTMDQERPAIRHSMIHGGHVHHHPHRVNQSENHHTSEFDSHCHSYVYHPHGLLSHWENDRPPLHNEPKTKKKKKKRRKNLDDDSLVKHAGEPIHI